MENKLEVSLHVKNEHGKFEIKVSDVACFRNIPITVKNWSASHIQSNEDSHYPINDIISVRHLYTWTNALNEEDRAWYGDDIYNTDNNTVQKSLVGVFDPTDKDHHQWFSKKEDAERYLESLKRITVDNVVDYVFDKYPNKRIYGGRDDDYKECIAQYKEQLTEMINKLIKQEKNGK